MFVLKTQLSAVRRPMVLGMFGDAPGFVAQKQPDMWAFDGPLVYQYGAITITIPKGTTTDLASTPKLLDWIPFLDIDGDSRLPGALHDGIYRLGREKGKDFADSVLYQACLDVGMSKFQAGVYYRGVHWFGASGWAEDGSMASYGSASAKFLTVADYEAFVRSGGSIYSVSP